MFASCFVKGMAERCVQAATPPTSRPLLANGLVVHSSLHAYSIIQDHYLD